MTLNIRKVDLVTLIEESIFILRENASDKNIKVTLETDIPKPFLVKTDSTRIKQIFVNLLSNAIKYNKENGYVKIILMQDNNLFKITFIDNGIGMTPEYRTNLFKPFERDLSNIHGIQGHGLGLSIVKKIITLMNGDIEVWSKLHVGTNILITLPMDIDNIDNKINNMKDIIKPEFSNIKIIKKGLKIILADDNPSQLMMIKKILESQECIIFEVVDGAELLDAALNKDYDLIITDITMPKLTGDEVIKELRNKNNKKPVIAVTGNVFKDDIEKYLEAGINEIISKPYKITTLIEIINSIIKE
jgi:CheY-like chemotaxis protein